MKKYFFIVFILIVSITSLLTQIPDKKLHIYICDVGQGDGILITKGMNQIVIDSGPNNSIESCLGSHMPFWDKTIEVAFMTHADSDHSFGFIQMLERYEIKHFIVSTLESSSRAESFERLKKIVIEKKIDVIEGTSDTALKVDGVYIQILFPDKDSLDKRSPTSNSSQVLGSRSGVTNDFCLVTYITYKKFTGLFPCDLSVKSETSMLLEAAVPHAYFLKVPHHGSSTGFSSPFLKAIKPQIAAISVGTKNRYGLPSPEVIKMLNEQHIQIVRTDEDGEIILTTDGERIWTK